MTSDERTELQMRCRWLHGHGPREQGAMLAEVAAWCDANGVGLEPYGEGTLISGFETRMAERLGFEAARFFISGTMAQSVALRIWCDRAGNPRFGMHPTSHLELHEQHGYSQLYGLSATLVGPTQEPVLASHFLAVKECLAAWLIELPTREIGGELQSWEQLEALKAAAREREARLHLDGARLWGCAPYYQRSYAEICAGFDSVYVSFYKAIGALPGALLLGPQDFIDEAAVWQRRAGGNLYTLSPNVASAEMRIEERLAAIPGDHARALSIAEILGTIDGVLVSPDPPHAPMMHVVLPVAMDVAVAARDRFAEERGVWLFATPSEADVPEKCRVELSVGEGARAISDAEVLEGFRAVVAG